MESIIEKKYQEKCNIPGDINENLPVLRRYTEKCEIIVEMGVRSVVSTWAFLAGNPKEITSIDLYHPSYYKSHDPQGCDIDLVEKSSRDQNIKFSFIQADVLSIEIPECDLLFIDTKHDYTQLKEELEIHSGKVKKFIIFHDTETFKSKGETPGDPGIWKAIEEFLDKDQRWEILEHLENNNGLTIIGRK
jgi:hypothetical protein